MRSAIISDTHSRPSSVLAALEIMATRGVDAIVHCGDISDADTVRLFPAHTHFVFGNTDYLRDEIAQAVNDVGATLHGAWGQLEFAGVSVAFTHGDDTQLLHDLEHANTFDFLFHGHTHVAKSIAPARRASSILAIQRVAVRFVA